MPCGDPYAQLPAGYVLASGERLQILSSDTPLDGATYPLDSRP